MAAPALGRSAHVDTFTRDNLPPADKWPDISLAGFEYPEELNVGVELTDRMVAQGFGDHDALIGNGRRRTYKELSDWTNRIAHALVEDYGIKPGNRILIRSANNPALVACWLGATKAGAVVVNSMPMLRAGEFGKIVDKAEVTLALCDTRLMDELVNCAKTSKHLKKKSSALTAPPITIAELDRIALSKSVTFDAAKTGRDDVALIGFTSGTTGEPKATMHFHRDLRSPPTAMPRRFFGNARRHIRRLAAARLYLRAWRARDLSAALRRHRDASGKRLAGQHDRDHQDLQSDRLVHRADRLSRHARRHAPGRGSVFAAGCGLGWRNAAGTCVRGMDCENRQADPRRHRLDRDAAHIHFQPARRRCARPRPESRSAATRPRSSATT